MKANAAVSILFMAGLAAAALVHAASTEHAEHAADPAEALSPELRRLLSEEMLLITDGMGGMVEAISLGDWEAVAKTAGKVERSFILKQKLTAEQAAELHGALPEGFVRMDHRFHETAGKLVHAAHRKDGDLATLLYFRMLDGCVSCHAQYAPRRFPGLAPSKAAAHEH